MNNTIFMKKKISKKLIKKTKEWLRKDGITFFRGVKEQYGKINAVWLEDKIPHAVHFREGMRVRNFMRSSGLCEGWDDHDFDNNWINLIKKCIKE